MQRPYRFGVDKVHPMVAPAYDNIKNMALDPGKAPWSAPRGYTTSIPEEVAAYKASLPLRRMHPQSKQTPKSKKAPSHTKESVICRAWRAILDYFKGVADDVLPRQTEANPNGDVAVPRLLLCLCCLRSEIKS